LLSKIALIVEYETLDGREEEFTALILDHARRTLHEEPGCLRFEVLKPADENGAPLPNKMMVSEFYADEAAFAAHGNNQRLAMVRAALGPLVKSRKLTRANVLGEPEEEAGLAPEELNASNDD
jgi:quinol monooxygenase YgiN